MIEKKRIPYEFLARWNPETGVLQGAHVKFIDTILEDGKAISQKDSDAMPVAVAGASGYPLGDILDALQISAITEFDAQKTVATAAVDEANTAKAEAEDAKATAESLAARVAVLEAEKEASAVEVSK